MFGPAPIAKSNFCLQPFPHISVGTRSFADGNVQAATEPGDNHTGVVALCIQGCSAARIPYLRCTGDRNKIKQERFNL